MRKIYKVVIILLGLGIIIFNNIVNRKIDIKLDDQIGVAFLDSNILLIIGEDESTLLVLDEGKTDNLKKFKYNKLNLLMLKDMPIDIEYDDKIILSGKTKIGDVKYMLKNDVMYISYEDTNMCIYMGKEYNVSPCQVIYFYNNDISNINLYYENEVVLYYYNKRLSKKITDKMHEDLIDIHSIKNGTITIILLGEDDYELIVIDNK